MSLWLAVPTAVISSLAFGFLIAKLEDWIRG